MPDVNTKTMRRKVIGITGGIGSGKSVVSRVLRCNGFEVYDCDSKAKWLMNTDTGLKEALIDHFGPEIYGKNGLNREKLAAIIFSDSSERSFVNTLVHSAVRKDIDSHIKQGSGDFFIEAALLPTSGLDNECDRVWLVEAPLEVRIKRVEKRDGKDVSEIEKRIESQDHEFDSLPSDKTIIIENNGYSPILVNILELTDKNINNQTFILPC